MHPCMAPAALADQPPQSCKLSESLLPVELTEFELEWVSGGMGGARSPRLEVGVLDGSGSESERIISGQREIGLLPAKMVKIFAAASPLPSQPAIGEEDNGEWCSCCVPGLLGGGKLCCCKFSSKL